MCREPRTQALAIFVLMHHEQSAIPSYFNSEKDIPWLARSTLYHPAIITMLKMRYGNAWEKFRTTLVEVVRGYGPLQSECAAMQLSSRAVPYKYSKLNIVHLS